MNKVQEKKHDGICILCQEESKKNRSFCEKHLSNFKQFQAELYKYRISNSLCTRCGSCPPQPGKRKCFECAAKGKMKRIKNIDYCICCGEDNKLFLTKTELCYNCLYGAKNNNGICPHSLQKPEKFIGLVLKA